MFMISYFTLMAMKITYSLSLNRKIQFQMALIIYNSSYIYIYIYIYDPGAQNQISHLNKSEILRSEKHHLNK